VKLPDGRTAARLVQPEWDPEHAAATCKVYHHVFAPDGRQLTKGDGGQFPHHRGLFVGWSKTRWREHTLEFWHMIHGESQRCRGFVEPAALGLPDGAQAIAIDWCAPDGDVVLHELRGLDVVAADDDHIVLHLAIDLRAPNGDVVLDGDPQHAGQQFRALQQFADDGHEPVRYVRPAEAAARGNDVWTGCGWTAAVLPLSGGGENEPVTVLRIEAPTNPGTPTWSTRPYGRFGATRTATVTASQPLRLDQYYVVARGERDAPWCAEQVRRWAR
jgi:hypothetical protein